MIAGDTTNKESQHFDAFVSYSRKDANFARSIVELLANGLRIWFDELQIPKIRRLRSGVQENDLNRVLEQGVDMSKAGILITNTDFINSESCMNIEARRLLQRKPQIPILNLGFPAASETADRLRQYASHPGAEPQGISRFDEAVEQLEAFLERPLEEDTYSPQPLEGGRVTWKINGHPVTLSAPGWKSLSWRPSVQAGDAAGPNVVQTINGHRLDVNLIVGKPGWTREALPRQFSRETSDSRWKYYEWAIGIAQMVMGGWSPRLRGRLESEIAESPFLKRIRERFALACIRIFSWWMYRGVCGIHVFHHDNRDHIAVTYRTRGARWTRKYSLLIPDPNGGSDFEFVFTGGCSGSFEDFCLYAHRLDEYVLSFQFGHDHCQSGTS